MMIMLFLMCAIAAFFFGFSCGILRKNPISNSRTPAVRELSEDLEKLMTEYRNFLNYDGSEQS